MQIGDLHATNEVSEYAKTSITLPKIRYNIKC